MSDSEAEIRASAASVAAGRPNFVAAGEAMHGPVNPNLVARLEEALDERIGESDAAGDEEWLAAHRYADPSYVPGEITIAVTLSPDLAARFPTPESVIVALRSVPKKQTDDELLRAQAEMIEGLQREHRRISDEDLAEVEKQWPARQLTIWPRS